MAHEAEYPMLTSGLHINGGSCAWSCTHIHTMNGYKICIADPVQYHNHKKLIRAEEDTETLSTRSAVVTPVVAYFQC